MITKKYTGKDMHEIMENVSRELGPEAVILSDQHKVRQKGLSGLFAKPLVEVSVMYDPQQTPAARNYAGGANQKTWKPSLTAAASHYAATAPANANANYAAAAQYAAPGTATVQYAAPAFTTVTLPNAGGSAAAPQGIRASEERAQRLLDSSVEQMTNLDRRMSLLERMLSDFVSKFNYVKRDITYDFSQGVTELFVRLVNQQVDEALATQLAAETDRLISVNPEVLPREAMEHLIVEKFGQPAPIRHKKFTKKVVLMLGPTGVGKTTTMVKLAADFALKQGKKVGIINTDTYRIAAHEQIMGYAEILKIPLGIVYQPTDLTAEIDRMSDREIIFIDIAGKSPGDLQHREDVEELLRAARPEDVLLCIAATTSFSAVKEIFDAYSYVPDYKVLVTKLDETKYRGVLLNICWYTKKRLAYLSTGQSVPDDIAEVDARRIAQSLLKDGGQAQS
ncbi:MAG: flagellar biosynthesis protein FlhF [Oscillospiraceae bacterium]|jgi:flagellar biosynthesis protein FlhF|nr:flagellar biosynthesis protein FlhF [Oscillospiraceae bacterium]